MFRLNTTNQNDVTFYIQDDKVWKQFLHSDGSTYRTVEYFPTREQAQAVLDKFRPEHVWEHGDVFDNDGGRMMYLNPCHGREQMVWINAPMVASSSMETYHRDCTFLFNIKDALSDRGLA